jgi:uncharacterized membrane protein
VESPRNFAFRAILRPPRSLSRRGQILLLCFFALCASLPGLFFFALGAWPVAGFLGLDVALLTLAFRAYGVSARAEERIELTTDRLMIRRIPAFGRMREFSFNPYWARIRLKARTDGSNELSIGSHGRWLPIAAMLSPGEKAHLARELQDALATLRA